jgi:hypothetical protein
MKLIRILMGLVFMEAIAFGQGTPLSFVKPQFLNDAGVPCAGCKLYTYLAGTSTANPEAQAVGINRNP